MWTFGTLLLVSLAAAAPPLPSPGRAARDLVRARTAAARFDFEGALDLGRSGLEAGDADPTLSWELYVTVGEMAATVGLAEEARDAFARALELNPSFTLPPDPSPRWLRPFARARDSLHGEHLSATAKSGTVGPRRRAEARVQGDPLHLAEKARLYVAHGTGYARTDLALSDHFEGEWTCAVSPCGFYLALVDGHGNEVRWVGDPSTPLIASDAPFHPGAPSPPRPFLRRMWPYFVLSGVLAAVGVYFTVRTVQEDAQFRDQRAQPSGYHYADTQTLDRERTRDDTVAVVTYSAALVAAGSGVALGW